MANAYHRKQLLEYSKQLGADIRKRQRMPDDDASLRTHSAAPASGPDMDDVLGQAGEMDARRGCSCVDDIRGSADMRGSAEGGAGGGLATGALKLGRGKGGGGVALSVSVQPLGASIDLSSPKDVVRGGVHAANGCDEGGGACRQRVWWWWCPCSQRVW